MVNKRLKGLTAPGIREHDTLNSEGAPAYLPSPEDAVVNVLMVGNTRGTFYASAKENFTLAATTFKSFKDTEFLAKATIYARNEGFMRTIPIAALVEISARNPRLFHEIHRQILRTPKDWSQFIDLSRDGPFRDGIGRAIKNEMISYISTLTPYQAIKYPTECRDMIRLCRCREVVNAPVIKFLMEGKDFGVLQFIAASRLSSMTPAEAACAIEEHSLPYEAVKIRRTMEPAVWSALFTHAPMFFLLKNLRNFDKNHVFDKRANKEIAIKRLTSPEAIKRAKILPFRLYQAYVKCENSQIKDALRRSVQLAAMNLPELKGKTTLLVDVSNSMTSDTTGNNLTAAVEAGILTGSIMDMGYTDVFAFDGSINGHVTNNIAIAFDKKGIMGVPEYLSKVNGGVTSISNALSYITDHKLVGDRVVIVTDSESWIGRTASAAEALFARYPKTHIYFIQVVQTPTRDLPDNDSRIHYIHGFNDNVLKFIASDTDAQIEEIRNVTWKPSKEQTTEYR